MYLTGVEKTNEEVNSLEEKHTLVIPPATCHHRCTIFQCSAGEKVQVISLFF